MSPDADPAADGLGGPAASARHLFGSSETADSAGVPWEGRRFEHAASSGDDGAADPDLLAALHAFARGTATASDVVEAVRGARMLVPLLAHAGETGETPDGRLVDKTQELSIATVAAPDGRAVLPAFTSVAALTSWNATARPVPAAGPRVALAAASEQTELVVVDPTSVTEFVLRRPAVKALATGQSWTAPWEDAAVQCAFRAAVEHEEPVVDVELSNGDRTARLRGPEVEVRLVLRPGLDRAQLDALLERVTAAWAASSIIADRVDSMTVRLIATH